MVRHAAAAAAVVGLCGCAQQAQMVRPSAAQLQALEPLSVVEVIGQDSLAAQDTFSAVNVNVLPNPSVPILAGALGGALGMAIINAEMQAEARRFAEKHLQPLRAALQGFDARATLADSLRQALAQQPSQFGSYAVAGVAPADGGPHIVVDTSYAMTPDFSALQVIAAVSIRASDNAGDKPVYRNVLVYQSPRQDVQEKTAADSKRMLEQENTRYAALHVDEDIGRANAALARRDPELSRLHQKIADEQFQHRQRRSQAAASSWDADTRAQRRAEAWATRRGEALKVAMRASGGEIAHMLQLDLADALAAGRVEQPRTVFKNGVREIDYRLGGGMISLAMSDSDASLKKPSPMVTVPMPVMGR
jgi:hypothetical protein